MFKMIVFVPAETFNKVLHLFSWVFNTTIGIKTLHWKKINLEMVFFRTLVVIMANPIRKITLKFSQTKYICTEM